MNVINQDINKKRRGRPPKNAQKVENEQNTTITAEENIVVRLALSDSEEDESGDDNHFTVNDEVPSKNHSSAIKPLSDADDSLNTSMLISGSNDSSKYYSASTVKTLIEEVKKRDRIIEALKSRTGSGGSSQKNPKRIRISYHHTEVIDVDTNNKFVPKCTDFKCWWCSETFDNLPAYIVQFYRNGIYYVFGNFCGFNCALKYNVRMLNDYKCATRHALTLSLKAKTTGDSNPIRLAGDSEMLESKGGIVSIDKFRDGFTVITDEMRMNLPPLIPLVHTIENYNN
jgi:hypothetical protein